MTHYFDSSAVVPLLVEEGASEAVRRFASSARQIVISSFASGEIASAFSRAVRTKQVQDRVAEDCLAGFDAWSRQTIVLACTDDDVRLGGVFVRRFDLALRLPDAIHLALAHRHRLQMVTLDTRIAIAGQALGIGVDMPG